MHNRHILYMARVLLLLLSYLRFSLFHLNSTHTHAYKHNKHNHAQAPCSSYRRALSPLGSFGYTHSLSLSVRLCFRLALLAVQLSTPTLPPDVFIISCLAVPCASSSQSQLAADDVSPLRQ